MVSNGVGCERLKMMSQKTNKQKTAFLKSNGWLAYYKKEMSAVSQISHHSSVMLKVTSNKLKPRTEEVIAEEKGFTYGHSTIEQVYVFNLFEQQQKHQ